MLKNFAQNVFKWHYFDQVYSRFTRDGKMAFFTSQTRPLRRETSQRRQPEVFLAVISLPLAVTDVCRRQILSRLFTAILMFKFWREATATSVPGLICQSGRRLPENVSNLSSLPSKQLLLHTPAAPAHHRNVH